MHFFIKTVSEDYCKLQTFIFNWKIVVTVRQNLRIILNSESVTVQKCFRSVCLGR
jgi:hypothetical protein